MNQYMESLHGYLREHPAVYRDGDIHSLLEHLWSSYTESNPVDSDGIRACLGQLEPVFPAASAEASDALFGVLCGLCGEYEKAAFLEGMRVGARLAAELAGETG